MMPKAGMFEQGEIIDGKYQVDGLCSGGGGMGDILFATPLQVAPEYRLVLKYCRDNNEEQLKRFRREVRLLGTFRGNSKIVQIWDENLDHEPPYFVMKYYEDGDLCAMAETLQTSIEAQEQYFLQIIDCIQELHSRQEFHRDIKPQNFLREGKNIVVSDLGLSTEVGSATAFTTSSAYWGTHGYIPPEFFRGGFKDADASGDIYMIGKTFYALLTGREPMYMTADGVPPPLFYVIGRCCNLDKVGRYQTLADLKQSLVVAYDVLLGRAGGKAQQLLSMLKTRLEQTNQYDVDEVAEFVEQLGLINSRDQIQMSLELPRPFFSLMAQRPLLNSLSIFLPIYESLVEERDYSWGYAEVIALNMREIFRSTDASDTQKTYALDLAIRASIYMNRFDAMNTCSAMIRGIQDDTLGFHVTSILLKHRDSFVSGIEPSSCVSNAIRNALHQIREHPEQN